MKQAKDSAEFLRPLLPLAATVWAVCEPNQHSALPVAAIIAASGGVARPVRASPTRFAKFQLQMARPCVDLRQSLPGRRNPAP